MDPNKERDFNSLKGNIKILFIEIILWTVFGGYCVSFGLKLSEFHMIIFLIVEIILLSGVIFLIIKSKIKYGRVW